jgi:hypothetical protein
MTETPSVHSLRKQGYKVRVLHSRRALFPKSHYYAAHLFGDSLPLSVLDAKGGLTRIEITTPDNKFYIGESRCSNKENFNHKLGNKIALNRALSVIERDSLPF